MAKAVLSIDSIVAEIQQYIGRKHQLPCTAKACWTACSKSLMSPIAMLVHRDKICKYNIKTGRVIKQMELKFFPPRTVSQKAEGFTATICGGFLYMFGGLLGDEGEMNKVAKFDVQDCTWSWRAPIPTARSGACAVTVGAAIYVIGGRTGDKKKCNIVEKYIPPQNNWETAPHLNHPRAYCSALVIDRSVFVIGGSLSRSLEYLDVFPPTAWEDFPTILPVAQDSTCVAAAIGRKIYVIGAWKRGALNISRSVFVLDLDSRSWTKLRRLPVDCGCSQALTLDGSIYLFCTSYSGGVIKYEPEIDRWLTLPHANGSYDECYLATLINEPLQSYSILTSRMDEAQTLLDRDHQTIDESVSVIQDVRHFDEAAAVDPGEAAALVAEQWTQHVELNLSSGSTPGLLMRLMVLSFTRHPAEFHTRLLHGPELKTCREQMQGLPCRLDSGALIFVEPFQYNVAIDAAMSRCGRLAVYHVITSERFEPHIMSAVRGLASRLNVRVRSKQTIFQPWEVDVVRTFLDVPDRSLRSIDSVTHSTTDAHGIENHRVFSGRSV